MVVGRVDVVVHVSGLRVLAEHRVVVRRAGVGHVAQGAALDAGQEQPGPDQPVAGHGVLAEQPLLEAGGEDVGDRLVERPGLALVDQPGGALGDGVGELVAEHVHGLGEPVERLAVTVAEDQLPAVPERVVVVALVVHRRHHRRACVVVGVAAVDLANIASDPATPSAASSTATSPLGPSPAVRTTSPGSADPLPAVCTTQAGPGAAAACTAARWRRTPSSCASICSIHSASSGRLSAIWRSR